MWFLFKEEEFHLNSSKNTTPYIIFYYEKSTIPRFVLNEGDTLFNLGTSSIPVKGELKSPNTLRRRGLNVMYREPGRVSKTCSPLLLLSEAQSELIKAWSVNVSLRVSGRKEQRPGWTKERSTCVEVSVSRARSGARPWGATSGEHLRSGPAVIITRVGTPAAPKRWNDGKGPLLCRLVFFIQFYYNFTFPKTLKKLCNVSPSPLLPLLKSKR